MNTKSLANSPPTGGEAVHATFAAAFGAELMKLRRQRPTWVLVAVGVLLLGLAMLLLAADPAVAFARHSLWASSVYQLLLVVQLMFAAGSGLILLTTTSRLVGMEYSLGTIRVILARGTGRIQLLLAKLASALVLALMLLIGYWLLVAIGTAILVLHQAGSLTPLTELQGVVWVNLGQALLSCAISAGACAVVGVTISTLARSVTGGMLVSVVFFPIDNALVLILIQLHRIAVPGPWVWVSGFLLGPSLNHLPTLLTSGREVSAGALPAPIVHFSLAVTLLVVLCWLVTLTLLAAVAVARRDVLA